MNVFLIHVLAGLVAHFMYELIVHHMIRAFFIHVLAGLVAHFMYELIVHPIYELAHHYMIGLM